MSLFIRVITLLYDMIANTLKYIEYMRILLMINCVDFLYLYFFLLIASNK